MKNQVEPAGGRIRFLLSVSSSHSALLLLRCTLLFLIPQYSSGRLDSGISAGLMIIIKQSQTKDS